MAPLTWFAPWPAEIQGIRIIHRVGRSGLASAIKEGLIAALHPIAVVMDSDGQHSPPLGSCAASNREGLDLVGESLPRPLRNPGTQETHRWLHPRQPAVVGVFKVIPAPERLHERLLVLRLTAAYRWCVKWT